MKKVKIFIFGAILILSSCSKPTINNDKSLEIRGQNYSLHPSIKLDFQYDHKTSTVFTNYEAPKFNRDSGDISIEIYDTLTKCPLILKHIPHLVTAKKDSAEIRWGKVIFEFAEDPLPGENDIFCPPIEKRTTPYAFCAEKDGKAVAICIQQMTDNEAMAKEIFETFRWID